MNNLEKKVTKLPRKVQWGYGATGFAAINTFTMFIFFGMYFFTDVVGLNPAFAGIVLSIVTLWDAITDPVIGFWSDKRDPKKGRRRPFLKYVAIPFTILSWLLFTDFGLSESMTKVYFFIVAFMFYTCQTLLDIPYTSLGAELTTDYDEISSLNSKRNFFATISGIATSVVFSIVFFIANYTESESQAWSITAGIFAVLTFISILVTYKTTDGYEREDVEIEETNYFQFFKTVFKNKVFLFTVLMYGCAIVSLAVQNSAFVYYMQNNLGLSENELTVALLIAWIPGLLIVGFMSKMSRTYSKKFAWIFAMSAWLISLIVFPLFVFPYYNNMFTIGLMQVISAFGYVPMYQIAFSMIADTVEVDEYKTGMRREGIYYGFANFLQKGGTALAIFISGIVLEQINYDPNTTLSDSTLEGIKYLFSIGSSVFLIISIVIAIINPMTRSRYNALKNAIEQKKQGVEVDSKPFEKLL